MLLQVFLAAAAIAVPQDVYSTSYNITADMLSPNYVPLALKMHQLKSSNGIEKRAQKIEITGVVSSKLIYVERGFSDSSSWTKCKSSGGGGGCPRCRSPIASDDMSDFPRQDLLTDDQKKPNLTKRSFPDSEATYFTSAFDNLKKLCGRGGCKDQYTTNDLVVTVDGKYLTTERRDGLINSINVLVAKSASKECKTTIEKIYSHGFCRTIKRNFCLYTIPKFFSIAAYEVSKPVEDYLYGFDVNIENRPIAKNGSPFCQSDTVIKEMATLLKDIAFQLKVALSIMGEIFCK
jgi:hypothetical protein